MTQPAQSPIKILFCIDNLLRGGTELQLIGLIERLDPKKYTPYLLTIRDSDPKLTPANCIHLAWNVPKLFSIQGLSSIRKLVQFLRAENIDIVQTFFQDSTIFAGAAAYLAKTKVRIACFRDLGFWHSKIQAFVLKKIYNRMTGFICNALIVREHFSTAFNLPPSRMVLLRNGVDVSKLIWVPTKPTVKHIGIVGNMTRHVKRTDLFIKAAAIVTRSHPDVVFHIIGDGHMKGELQNLATRLGVINNLHFAGRVNDVTKYLEQLDIGVICSDSEGLSNALIEYMFKGVASIATKVGGNPELIEDSITGLLVPPDNFEALAQAMFKLINDDELRKKITHCARERVEAEYSWQKCIATHDEFYTSQLSSHWATH